MSTMRQRRRRFSAINQVITIRAPMWLVEIAGGMTPAEISRAIRQYIKKDTP